MSRTPITPSEGGHPQHTNGTSVAAQSEETGSAFKAALEQIDRIKIKLRAISGELTEAVSLLKTAEKEKRANRKEIEAVRAKLRKIRSVEL
jgi:hypothetical protein